MTPKMWGTTRSGRINLPAWGKKETGGGGKREVLSKPDLGCESGRGRGGLEGSQEEKFTRGTLGGEV